MNQRKWWQPQFQLYSCFIVTMSNRDKKICVWYISIMSGSLTVTPAKLLLIFWRALSLYPEMPCSMEITVAANTALWPNGKEREVTGNSPTSKMGGRKTLYYFISLTSYACSICISVVSEWFNCSDLWHLFSTCALAFVVSNVSYHKSFC